MAKWVFSNKPNNYFIKLQNNSFWTEFAENGKQTIWQQVELGNFEPILYNPNTKIYLKLTDTKIIYGFGNIESLALDIVENSGKWEIKPTIDPNPSTER